jgi:hypothetical protein
MKIIIELLFFIIKKKAYANILLSIIAFCIVFLVKYQNGDDELLIDILFDSIEFAILLSAAFAILFLGAQKAFNHLLLRYNTSKAYCALFGMGFINNHFINNEIDNLKNKAVVIADEFDPTEHEQFSDHYIGVLLHDITDEDLFEKLDISNMSNAVIALGSDTKNIELAMDLMKNYQTSNDTHSINIVVHLINFDLAPLLYNFLIQNESSLSNVDLKIFSFYQECTEQLFRENNPLGENRVVFKSGKTYKIIVSGDNELISEIIKEIALRAHFPDENKIEITVVDSDPDSSLKVLYRTYPQIDEVNSIEIKKLSLDPKTLEYYKHPIWHSEELLCVILGYIDENKNLEISVDLSNSTYRNDIIDDKMKTVVYFPMFDNCSLREMIQKDNESFKNFISYGNASEIFTKSNLFAEESYKIAKLIHANYGDRYTPWELQTTDENTFEQIDKKWFNNSKYTDKLSSIAQSKHLDIKLSAMGLQKLRSNKKAEELLKINRKKVDEVFNKERDLLIINDKELTEYSLELEKCYKGESYEIKYMPSKFKTLFEKLIRAEHNRWNAFHYINDWSYNPVKNKAKKEHNCLKSLKDFHEKDLQLTVIYDIYAILYLPNYLAESGFEIVNYGSVTLH